MLAIGPTSQTSANPRVATQGCAGNSVVVGRADVAQLLEQPTTLQLLRPCWASTSLMFYVQVLVLLRIATARHSP
jgi:hypothetical protein